MNSWNTMRPYGIMRRTVYLEKGWYKDAIGAMLGVMKETGKIVFFRKSVWLQLL